MRFGACAALLAASFAVSASAAELVKPGLWRIDATLLRVGTDGLVLVDPRDAARDEIARIAQAPVRAAILTAAGDSASMAQGVPVIVNRRAAGAAPHAGVVTYDMDYRLKAAGVVAEVEHVGRGRTAADSVVYFPDLRVVAVGDLYTAAMPQPDCASGGSYAGWAAAITHLLWFDFDVAVPSRGAVVGKAELRELKARLEGLAARGGCTPG